MEATLALPCRMAVWAVWKLSSELSRLRRAWRKSSSEMRPWLKRDSMRLKVSRSLVWLASRRAASLVWPASAASAWTKPCLRRSWSMVTSRSPAFTSWPSFTWRALISPITEVPTLMRIMAWISPLATMVSRMSPLATASQAKALSSSRAPPKVTPSTRSRTRATPPTMRKRVFDEAIYLAPIRRRPIPATRGRNTQITAPAVFMRSRWRRAR